MHRDNGFTVLRLAAAFLVLLTHSYVLLGSPAEPFVKLTGLIPFSGLGVDAFFGLSGFLIAVSLLRQPTAMVFLRNRALRILPALAVVVALTVFALGPAVTTSQEYWKASGTYSYLLNATMYSWWPYLPGAFTDNPVSVVNGSLWTLAHEASCYVLLLLIAWCGALNWRGILVLLAISLTVYFNDAFPRYQYLLGVELYNFNRFGCLFLSGSLLACLHRRFALPWAKVVAFAALCVIGAFFVGQWERSAFSLIYLVSWPAFVVALAFSMTRMAWLNEYDFSYGLYLYSFPVQQLIVHVLGKEISVLTLTALATAVALCLAMVSWFVIEKPALMLKGRAKPSSAIPGRSPLRDESLEQGAS
ncbi:acyltransferase family protein [Roseomonas sp. BN140053]|uniref:acyltransferase family protein n=1 Tax=Roseomonas sp. BN140053 TaxID=3391898 RepID=UPI0039EBA4D0